MLFKYSLILLLFASCSSNNERAENVLDLKSCKLDSTSVDNKAMLININSNISKLSPCLKNYIKFSNKNKFSFSGCVRLVVSKSGQVKRVGLYPNNLPKDLKMCIEQELWFFDFKNLYLDKKQNLSFPIQLSQ